MERKRILDWGYYNNERYKELEEKYLETKSHKVLEEMYQFLLKYYDYKLRAYTLDKGIKFSKEKCQELVHEMATRSVMHYLYHPKIKGDFKMKKLSAYACYDFIKILYNQSKDCNKDYGNEGKYHFDFSRIEMLQDGEIELNEIDYKILESIINCPGMTIDDLCNEFEMTKKEMNKHLDKVREWYANYEAL